MPGRAVVRFWLGGEAWNGRAKGMFAKREMLAASGAEDRKHSAEDALACLAEQGAARRRARQYRGSSGRRRWRFAARLARQYPRKVEFHDTILHPHAQNRVPQCSGTCLFVLPSLTEKLARSLPLRPCAACLCDVSTIIAKVVDKYPRRLCSGSAAAILRSSSGVELQSIVIVRLRVHLSVSVDEN